MCGFSRRPGCIEITVKLGGKTLVLLSKRYYLTHKSNGAFSAHTFAKNANVWGTRNWCRNFHVQRKSRTFGLRLAYSITKRAKD
jgi:hypothetical protein